MFTILLKGQETPPGSGWAGIPKGKKGGFRKRSGDHWLYWYPGEHHKRHKERREKKKPEGLMLDMEAFEELHSEHQPKKPEGPPRPEYDDKELLSAFDALQSEIADRKDHYWEVHGSPEHIMETFWDSKFGAFNWNVDDDMALGVISFIQKDQLPQKLAEMPPKELLKMVRERQDKGSSLLETKVDHYREIPNEKQHRTDAEVAVLDATALWTLGNVESVRDPSKYKEDLADDDAIEGAGDWVVENPTKEDYESAHRIMKMLAYKENPDSDSTVFRGMSLPASAFEGLDKGKEFDLRSCSSWSSSGNVAKGFMQEAPDETDGEATVKFLLEMVGTRGSFLNDMSGAKGEQEFVSGGKVRIKNISDFDYHPGDRDYTIIEVEPVPMQKAQSPDVSDKVQQYIDKQLDKRQRPKKTVKKSGFTTLVQGVVSKARKLDDRLTFQGMKISIETDKGNVRSGVDPNGHEWKTVMPRPYGYIRGTLGVDGDHLDVTVGPNEDADRVWVIHTKERGTDKYDEDKAFVGFDTKEDVIATFRKQFDQPDLHMGPVSEYSMEDFKEKIKDTRDNPRRLGRGKNVSKSFRTRVTKD